MRYAAPVGSLLVRPAPRASSPADILCECTSELRAAASGAMIECTAHWQSRSIRRVFRLLMEFSTRIVFRPSVQSYQK